MPESLRDRIAVALKAEAEKRGIYRIADFDFPFLADAVIAALGLERQNAPQGFTQHRYVTNWEADDAH